MKSVGPRELQDLAQGGTEIVDVRDGAEWARGHIPGARHVPLAQIKADPKAVLGRDDVAFVCAKGSRSATAAKIAEEIGLTKVFSLEGGTVAWIAAGLPIDVPKAAAQEASPSAPSESDPIDPALDQIIGANLHQLRVAHGFSLDDLAREAGVSRTLLGQIENGKTIPSIGVVWKIAQAMGLPFSSLLSTEPRVGTKVTSRTEAKKLLSADGRFSSRALYSFGDPHAAEFYELFLAPHSREDADPHRPGTRENLIVTAGRLELHIGRDVRNLGAGDCVIFSADVPHSYVNPGQDECWMYLVMNYTRPQP